MKNSASIAVFAHNEQSKIEAALNGLIFSGIDAHVPIHVLANGCNDKTAEIVSQISRAHPQIRLHIIELGDKANAWNYYVHGVGESASIHCFIDGDVEIQPGAIRALSDALKASPGSRAATGAPVSGRHRESWLQALEMHGGLAGNLYALSSDFIERIRLIELRIPVGTIGEDGFVGAMASFDLHPEAGWDSRRITLARNASFAFDSLDWRKQADLKLYVRRRIRYALREIQNRMLRSHIKSNGYRNMPSHITEFYARYPEHLSARWRGFDTVFHILALRRIFREIKSSG